MMNAVSVGVGTGRVAVFVAWTAFVLDDKADWARIASRLDIKPVIATYIPSMTTSKMIKNPKAYPLFMNSIVPWLVWNATQRNATVPLGKWFSCAATTSRRTHYTRKANRRQTHVRDGEWDGG